MPLDGEKWPVGRHWALFSSRTGAVALANETASAIWARYSLDFDVPATVHWASRTWGLAEVDASEAVDVAISTWRAAGLIEAKADVVAPDPPKLVAPLTGYAHHSYATSWGAFTLVCEDPYAEAVMSAVLSPLAATQPERRARRATVLLEIRGGTNAYWLTRDGAIVCEPCNISPARHEVLKQLLIDDQAPERTSAVLHAGAVSIGGRAVVFPGDCGRGKSTLTACLVHAGADFVGDDLIPVEQNGAWVGAYPVALSVKTGARELVRSLHADRRWSDLIDVNGWELRFVDLSERRPAADRVEIGAIVFPHFVPGAAPSCERIEPERTLQTLIASGSRPVGAEPSMEGLCRMADRIPAFALTYGDWRDAHAMIVGLVGSSAR